MKGLHGVLCFTSFIQIVVLGVLLASSHAQNQNLRKYFFIFSSKWQYLLYQNLHTQGSLRRAQQSPNHLPRKVQSSTSTFIIFTLYNKPRASEEYTYMAYVIVRTQNHFHYYYFTFGYLVLLIFSTLNNNKSESPRFKLHNMI